MQDRDSVVNDSSHGPGKRPETGFTRHSSLDLPAAKPESPLQVVASTTTTEKG